MNGAKVIHQADIIISEKWALFTSPYQRRLSALTRYIRSYKGDKQRGWGTQNTEHKIQNAEHISFKENNSARMKLPIAPAIFAIISNGFHLSASSLSTPQNKMTTAPSNCPCGEKGSNSGGGRIVGGDDAEPHEYPWQVGKTKWRSRLWWWWWSEYYYFA